MGWSREKHRLVNSTMGPGYANNYFPIERGYYLAKLTRKKS
jgi:hypothetical protein